MAGRVTQSPLEILAEPNTQKGRVTQSPLEILAEPSTQKGRVTQSPLEVLAEPNTQKGRVTQTVLEVLCKYVEPIPFVPPSCKVVVNTNVAVNYYIRLKNQSGEQEALFDDWLTLEYSRIINGIYAYTLVFSDNDDPRFDLFDLDDQIEIYRSVPGSIDWYPAFEGFHRKPLKITNEDGYKTFTSIGVGYNDLLNRTIIAYTAGTILADKNAVAETVMKEYVSENCTPIADLSGNARLSLTYYTAALTGFTVDADNGEGVTWTGSRAYENLLDVLQDIANFSNIDFLVESNGAAQYMFKTYVDQLGADRTKDGLDPSTGKNAAGNVPVVLSIPMGTLQSTSYEYDRLAEVNAIVVMGKGESFSRVTVTRRDPTAIGDSLWNRREASRPLSSYDSLYETASLNTYGDEVLEELQAKEVFEFVPLQQPKMLYGKHYFLGDKIVVKYGDTERNKRIIGERIRIANKREAITLQFADVPEALS